MESILGVLSIGYGIFRLDACLLGIAVALLVSWWLNRSKYNYPPGPWALPIIGQLLSPPRQSHRRQIYSDWAKKYGDIVMTKVAVGHLVILHSLPLIKEAFVEKAAEFTDRPTVGLQASRSKNKGILFSNGEYWRKHRKFSLGALRSLGGLGTNKMEESIMEEARYLVEEIERTNGEPIDLRFLLGNAVSNVICNVVFGCRYDYNDPEFSEILEIINEMIRLSAGPMLPTWAKYIPFVIRGLQKNMARVDAVRVYVNKHIEEHKATMDPNNPRDLIDSYLSEFMPQNECDESDLRAVVLGLFVAGTETTSGSLYWAHLFMANHPDVQRKVHEEIDHIVGRDRLPCYSDIDKLTYTEATVLETQRKACIASGVIPHFNQNPAKIGGYDIPAQSIIDINIFHLMFNPDLWEKPETFNPSRFIDTEGHIYKPEHFIPFGIGPRICMGRKLADMEMAIFFSQIIQNFEIRRPEGVGPISEEHYGNATLSPERHKLCFVKRD